MLGRKAETAMNAVPMTVAVDAKDVHDGILSARLVGTIAGSSFALNVRHSHDQRHLLTKAYRLQAM